MHDQNTDYFEVEIILCRIFIDQFHDINNSNLHANCIFYHWFIL